MLDNLTLALERVDLKDFYLSTMPAETAVDRVVLAHLRKDDQALMNEKWPAMISMITTKLDEVQKGSGSRAPSSEQQ